MRKYDDIPKVLFSSLYNKTCLVEEKMEKPTYFACLPTLSAGKGDKLNIVFLLMEDENSFNHGHVPSAALCKGNVLEEIGY